MIGQFMEGESNRSLPPSTLCSTCLVVMSVYATTESVASWLCTCKQQKQILQTQLKFSAGKYVGRHFKHAWQGAPKGKYVRFRPSKNSQ